MIEGFSDKPFFIAISTGVLAQLIKVLTFLIVEKRVNYKRLVQTDGSPNMHSAAMSALTLAIGFKEGFASSLFALSLCLSTLVMVDIMNVKNAASRQAEVIYIIMDRIRRKDPAKTQSPRGNSKGNHRLGLSYKPVDVLTGIALGLLFTLWLY